MTRQIICVSCPNGCEMKVDVDNGKINSIHGNTCKRGVDYAQSEIDNPKRMLTTTVKVKNSSDHFLPVRSKSPLPKDLLQECMQKINKVELEAPVYMGETIIPNILNTGVDIIAAKPLNV